MTKSSNQKSIIDIGVRKQLLLDDRLIESSRGIEWAMNCPYQPPEPVLKLDQP